MLEIIDSIVNMLINAQEVLTSTAKTLNEMTFDTTLVSRYLGYMRYMMGTPLYILFSTVALIALAVTIYTVITKGISYLKSCL